MMNGNLVDYERLIRDSSLSPAILLVRLATAIARDFGCERVSLFFRDGDGRYVTALAQGLESMDIDVKPGEGLVGKAIAAGIPLVSNEASYDHRSLCRVRDHYTGFQTRSLMVAPIISATGAPAGAIQLINRIGGPFGEMDACRLAALCTTLLPLVNRLPRPIRNLWSEEAERAAGRRPNA